MVSAFLDFLFPKRSLLGREGAWVTEEERRQMRSHPVVLQAPQLRSLGVRFVDRIAAAADIREAPLLRKAVHTFKYKRVRGLAEDLARLIVDAASHLDLSGQPVLVPVPLHWRRRFARGFNQADLLARAASATLGFRVEPLLRRVRFTGSQVGRNRVERWTALREAFVAREGPLPASVILIDDLSTTGATLEECAKALRDAGVAKVQGLVVAHG